MYNSVGVTFGKRHPASRHAELDGLINLLDRQRRAVRITERIIRQRVTTLQGRPEVREIERRAAELRRTLEVLTGRTGKG